MDTTQPAEPPAEHPAASGGNPVPPAPEVPGFRVERLLGVGGSAAVWLVRDDDGAPFALKVPATGGGGALNAFEARREVNILARLEHPHLLRMYAVVETDHGAGLICGYAAGGSAAGLVAARGPVRPGEAVSILVGIAEALGYLHARGAAHGDVSPGNILLTSEGRPLLADFGSGRLLGEPGVRRLGTPGFSAPESTDAAEPALGAAMDMYALAAAGWFLLTGRTPPPSRDRPPLSILVPGVGRELPALLEAGLAEDPAERPAADEFAAAAFRSAPALPVDLVAAVHPDVHPELLTRRTGSAGAGTEKRKHWRGKRGPSGVAGGPERGRSRALGRRPGRGRGQARGVARRSGAAGRGWWGNVRWGSGRRGNALPGGGTDADRAPVVRERSVEENAARGQAPGTRRDGRHVQRGRGSRSSPMGSRVFPVAAAVVVVAVLLLAGIALAAPDLLRARGAGAGAPDNPPGGSQGAARSTSAPSSAPARTPTPEASTPEAPTRPAPGGPAETVESLRAVTAAEDPAKALPALAELRSRAFASADPSLLQYVNAPGSEALQADQEQVARLAAEGHALSGLVMEAAVVDGSGAAPAAQGTATAELHVRLRVSGYTQVDSAGAVLRHGQAQQQEVLLMLVRSGGEWRISRILAPQ
ncbi:serine/threonine-protein kinase [Arthrobacter sp. zg-Y1171]|uniref:serine/threonine-protein kinase n=1 Tax=Arthrobacter sp. zg-Y1171 TaxID=2964610 RepID=UPI00210493C7|nr:serine/threonine-protein kinase [Arthrobacter sp. zg-Y1171]MCQ1995909.1 protein kinase [Arthrobacter sp. zg-Y1171]UWX83012.1 protein kinase [Arthrobacter sp. zg-Y1171]